LDYLNNQDFWNTIYKYKEYGFEPLNWISNFSNEIDKDVIGSSLNKIKGTNYKITPNWIDYFHKCQGKVPELTRRFYDFNYTLSQSETGIKNALGVLFITNNVSENPEKRFNLLNNFLSSFKSKLNTKKIIAISSFSKKNFGILDFIQIRRGNKIGYVVADNYITQVTDITAAPESEIHTQITVSGAIENLNLLGCTSEFRIYPIYDGPTESILDTTRKNFDSITLSNNIYMEDYSSVKKGDLLFGATSTGTTSNELPLRYEDIEEGMNVILTDTFGTMVPLNLYLLTQINEKNISLFEKNNISYDLLKKIKVEIFNNLTHPRFELGKLISKYCPEFGSKYEKTQHITCVFPVLSKGILALKHLSEYINNEMVIDNIPIKYQDISCYAIKEYFIQNSTSSVNGCHTIIASKEITDSLIQDLRKIHLEPEIIGKIGKKEKKSLIFTDPNFDKYFPPRSKIQKKIRGFKKKENYKKL